MKRILIRSGFIILLILCLFACASAARLREGDWEYEFARVDGIQAAMITDYNPKEDPPQTLIVPEELGGCPVRGIRSYCFGDYRYDENRESHEIKSPKTLVLLADAAEGKEIFKISWQGQRLEMSEGYMEYRLEETNKDDHDLPDEQLILIIGDTEMHLTRIEEEQ